jgi:hypothetical protein
VNLKTGALLSVIVAAGLAVWLWPGSSRVTVRPLPEEPHPARPTATASAPAAPPEWPPAGERPALAPLRYRGVAFQVQTNYRVLETFTPVLDEIAALGADTVLIATAGWMEHARSQALVIEQRKTPGREDFVALLRAARARGLQVMLMPMVLLSHPRGTEWRGMIEPPDRPRWWRDYRDFINYFADIANEGQATALLVGSELVRVETETEEWVKTIAAVRERYSGQVGYSANWDSYEKVQFWDRLDFVGMTSYFKLVEHEQPTVAELVERWRPIHASVVAWQKQLGRPIVLTEVGWCSQVGAAAAPWNYYQNPRATPEGLEEQRRLYEAFVSVWLDTPGLSGVIWWEWPPEAGGLDDYGYTPKGKPAERVLREWLDATVPHRPAPPTTRPARP